MSDYMPRTSTAGGTTDPMCAGYFSEFLSCFLGAGYAGNGFCDNEVPIDGEGDLAFVFLRHTTTTSLLGFACRTSSLLNLTVGEDILMADQL